MSWLEQHISLHSEDSPNEEVANWLTHLVGALGGVAGTIALLRKARIEESGLSFAFIVFGAAMTLLFAASTLYHMSPAGSRTKRLFRLGDHVSIYLLIAGTYTPVMSAVGSTWAWSTLGIVWFLAAAGITLKIILWDRFKKAQLGLFLVMGWLAVIRIDQILDRLPRAFFGLVLLGGASYTIGTVFYSLKKMPYHHAIWHMFVLGGAVSFFLAVYLFV